MGSDLMVQAGTVTLLFAELINSASQFQNFDDPGVQRAFNLRHKLVRKAITEDCGDELQWSDEGVMAAFTSPADAVRCAVKIQQTAKRPAEGGRLAVRIGLDVGEIPERRTSLPVTLTASVRRLCRRAEEGQILCTSPVEQLLASRRAFNFHELGSPAANGTGRQVSISEVLYERDDPAALLNHTPFVGRADQLRRLTVKLDEVCNGRGAMVTLRGEAGAGKTRLLEEVADLALQRGMKVLKGACYDGDWQRPCGPFAEAIREFARQASADELRQTLGARASTIARIVPALHELIPGLTEPAPLEGEEERFRLLDAVAQSLIALARSAPLLLILDDLHLADRGTVALLNHISHFVTANAILLICAFRESDVRPGDPLMTVVASISRSRNFENVVLRGLTPDSVEELLRTIADRDAPPAFAEAIVKETGGNPFFIRELLLHLMDEGRILQEGQQPWSSQLGVDDLGVSEGVRDLVAQRLSRVSDEARRLLSIGAAFHSSFSFEVAAAVAGMDENTALAAIDEAIDARLLRPGDDHDTFEFSHAIIRHTLYAELNPVRRLRVHRQIAEQMERVWGERAGEHAAELAYQFWRGAGAAGGARGADYAIAAATHAEAAYDYDEVAALLRIAMELLAPDDPRRARLLGRRALALTWALNHEEAVTSAGEAGELIAESEGASAAADFYELVARTMSRAGNIRGAWTMAQHGLRLIDARRDIVWASLTEIDISRKEAEDQDNPGIRVDSPASRELYAVLKRLPREQLRTRDFDPPFASREEVLRDPESPPTALLMLAGDFRRGAALQQQEAAEDEQRGAVARAIRGWADLARCQIVRGSFSEGRAALDRAAKLAARMTAPSFGLLTLVAAQGELCYATDEGWADMITNSAAASFMDGAGPENNWASAMVNAYVSYLLLQINQPELAMERINVVMPALERGAPWARTYCSTACIAAATMWMLNRTEHVCAIERNIRLKVLAPDFRSPLSDSRLSLARLCALQARHDEAEEWFDKARAALDQQEARPLRAIADFDQALMYVRRAAPGDKQRAAARLETAARQFEHLTMAGWVRRAHALAIADAN
jgi:hypothetical protein